MKNILVVYYSHTGQLKTVLDRILEPLQKNDAVNVDYAEIRVGVDYPFPWGKKTFFDIFPETVNETPMPILPLNIQNPQKYDLVVIGAQVWYLSLSIPLTSFFKSKEAEGLLKDKNVITVFGVRNMWLSAVNSTKSHLSRLKANHIGNIVLGDRKDNLVSAYTIDKWLMSGKKKALLFPEAGISKNIIEESVKFGNIISEYLFGTLPKEELQNKIKENDGMYFRYHLLKIDLKAKKVFKKFANFILKAKSKKSRSRRVALYKYYLYFAIYGVSPFVAFFLMIKAKLCQSSVNEEIRMFGSVEG